MIQHSEAPYNNVARRDTGVSNVTLGFWLFIASEVMLFGALFSSYALLRVSATNWPLGGDVLSVGLGWANTAVLLVLTVVAMRAGRVRPNRAPTLLLIVSALAVLFLMMKGFEYRTEWQAGRLPSTSTFLAMYYTLTGIHAAHVLGGIVANVWVMAGAASVGEAMTASRLKIVGRYWTFVDLVWMVMFVGLYLS